MERLHESNSESDTSLNETGIWGKDPRGAGSLYNGRMAETVSTAASSSRVEYRYLDGIRGLAALAVVLYHAYLFTGSSDVSAREMPLVRLTIGWGYLGVPVFIVLSGYVLMLPLLRSPHLQFSGGVAAYVRRRARRILPPYYAALMASLVLIAVIPVLRHPGGTQWDTKLPITVPSVLAHVVLLHDLSPAWIGKINGPMWSVAVEWQIYFILPMIFLPLWRRFDPFAVTFCIAIISIAFPVMSGIGTSVHPWFLGLFTMGMLSAQVTRGWRISLWRLVAGLLGLCVVATVTCKWTSDVGVGRNCASEVGVGVIVAVALTVLGSGAAAGGRSKARSLLECRALIFAGTISYSVYLLHSPLLALGNLLLIPLGLPVVAHYLVMTFVCVPIALGICWLFYLGVEKHFQNSRQRHAVVELTGVDHTASMDVRGELEAGLSREPQ